MPRLTPSGILLLAALACGPADSAALAASSGRGADVHEPEGPRRWVCFYGRTLSRAAWDRLDLAIVDPDRFELYGSTPPRAPGAGPARVAYLSVGEAQENRRTWAAVKGRPYVVEDNPDWPGAHRVDLRSEDWRRLIVDQEVPRFLAQGYAGVFLDTIDAASYLESKDPARFGGSRKAAVDLVAELRALHPGMRLYVNNGLDLLGDIGTSIDGVAVEDLYTRCPPKGGRCGPTPETVAREKEALLRRFRAATGKPVLVLLYSGVGEQDARWIRAAERRCRKNGFLPYLASPSLDRLGVVDPDGAP